MTGQERGDYVTIDKLKSYRNLCAEISDIKSQLDKRYAGDTVQSASKHPYSVHSVRVEGYKSDGNTISLLTRLSILERSRAEVEEFVKGISDYNIKRIIKYRYMIGKRPMSWQAIAMKLGYSAEHTPKRKLKKYFQNVGNVGF